MRFYRQEQLASQLETFFTEVKGQFFEKLDGKSMYEAELAVQDLTRRFGLKCLALFVARQGDGDTGPRTTTPDGHCLPRHAKQKKRKYTSIFGDLEIFRTYYWKEGEAGFYPLDAALSLPERQCSYLLVEHFQDYLTSASYDQSCDWIEKYQGVRLPKRVQEDMAQAIGGCVETYYEQKPTISESSEGAVLCLQADCTGVRMVSREKPNASESKKEDSSNTRKGLRREAVVTSDFSFDPSPRSPQSFLDHLFSPKATSVARRQSPPVVKPRAPRNKQVFATMRDKETAFVQLAQRVIGRNPKQDKPIFFLFDGDCTLEFWAREVVETAGWEDRIVGYGLDFYHVSQYVWNVAKALFAGNDNEQKQWVRKIFRALLEGRVSRVIGALRQIRTKDARGLSALAKKEIKKTITYFVNHKHRMKYDQYLKAGYPISTGVIEGACNSLVKWRTDGPGMKWTTKGAQGVLNLCAVHENKDQKEFYEYLREKEHQRLYGKKVA